MFIFELLIYVLFAWVMCSLAKKSENNQHLLAEYGVYSNGFDRYLWAYMLFFAFVSAIRWRVGVDSIAYIAIFQEGKVRPGSTEHLWDWLVRFVHDNGLHFTVGTGIVAFAQIYLLTKSLKDYRYILVWLPILIFGGRYYLDLMNGVRQMVAACGFVYLSRFIIDRKIIPYAVGVFLLSLIHKSAIILLPIYLIAYIPASKIAIAHKRTLCLGILTTCFIIGQAPAFQGFIEYFTPLAASTGYDNYSYWYSNILTGKSAEKLSMGPIMISFLLSSVIVIWYAPVLSEVFGTKIKYFNIWYLFSFVFSCGYFLVCNTSHLFIRPLQFFELFQAIMLSLLLHYLYVSGLYRKFYIVLFIICTCTLAGVYKDTGKQYENTTYKTYFGRLK